jgi:hypothetical protein
LINRSQENAQIQEQSATQWENGARIVKTSEDQYQRPDSNSSKSSSAEQNGSAKVNAHNPPSIHQHQPIKPDFNRVFI